MSDMQIEKVLEQMRALQGEAQTRVEPPAAGEGEDGKSLDFGEVLQNSLEQVNETQQAAGELSDAFIRGDQDVQLPDVMLALQKADVSFKAMSEVRNRLVEAYQEIMNMQI